MALIKCTECGKMISSRALKCPDCGCPVEKPKRHNRICPECGQLVDMSDVATEKCENCGCSIAMFDKLQYQKKSELLNILDSLIVNKQSKLLKCPDCGKMVSIRALQCPNCGCPRSVFVGNHNTIKDNTPNESTIQYTNKDENFSALEREAKNGNTESMVRLAYAYENGKGVEKKSTLAYYWYKKAAEMDNIEGMVNYARLLEVMDRRRDQAMIWVQKAKALGANNVYTIIGDEQNRRQNNDEAILGYNIASQNKEKGAEWKKQSCSSFSTSFMDVHTNKKKSQNGLFDLIPLKAFVGVISSLIIVVLWWNSCGGGNSQDNEFFQKGYIYTAQETTYNAFNSPISYTYTLTMYNDGSITLNEKTSNTDITYDCTLTKHCESERDIRVTWFELEGKRYSRATTLYFDVHGNCYHPMGRSGHDAIASGKYDFTLSKRKLN